MTRADSGSLVRILIEERNPLARSRAHVELGRRAASRGEAQRALQHYREALLLDPTDPDARAVAGELEGQLGRPPAARLGGVVGRVLGRVARG